MTPPIVSLVAFCSLLLLVPRRDRSLARLGSLTAPAAPAGTRRRPVERVRTIVVVVSCAVPAALLVGGTRVAVAGIAGMVAAGVARRIVRQCRQRRSRRRHQRGVIRFCDALSAELRGGLPALTALERSCAGEPELAPVVSAARLGADVPAALRGCGGVPGAQGLRAVAAAWEVAGTSGAAFAGVLERVAAGLRSDEDARAEVEAALGPPRATAKMLAVLPLFGLGLGSSMGADPVGFLVASQWGLGCLLVGIVLSLAGLWWVERLAVSAEL
ncbi:MAG: tight adherence protein [Nocardioidaceae bacterium]|nr:tight adherence protein [Nocardioidaceae bacterium]